MAIPALDDVPVYLMPVAAVFGYYFLAAIFRSAYLLYMSRDKTHYPPDLQFYAISGLFALFAYSFTIGTVEGMFQKVDHASFDPFHWLELERTTNTTLITAAYKEKVQYFHPSNTETGDATALQRVISAYRALTEELAMRNFQRYGNPSGPLLVPMFQLSLPRWLFQPHPPVAVYMGIVYLSMTAIFAYMINQYMKKSSDGEDEDDEGEDLDYETSNVSQVDLAYIAQRLTPTLTHMDILLLVLTVPSNRKWATQDLNRIAKIRDERLSKKPQSPKHDVSFKQLLEEGGWADDDEQEMDLVKKAEAEKQQELERLNRATGKATVLLESLDDGVLGQQWVERTLAEAGNWPPKNLGILKGTTFEYKGRNLAPLDHPAVRRMLCMLQGRLNSQMLNNHKDLLHAGSQRLVDQTYFQASMTFRGRIGLLLEALLRMGLAFNSYRLLKTGVEAAAMFKIGCKFEDELWFKGVVQAQYGCFPSLEKQSAEITTGSDGAEVAPGDDAQMALELTRPHAENFLRSKLDQFQKQGIPPQVGLAQYREGWWFLVRCERLDGRGQPETVDRSDPTLTTLNVDEKTISLFESEEMKNVLLAAVPQIYGNVAQKTVKVQLPFKAPRVAGKYKFLITVISHDFLGADSEMDFSADIRDATTVARTNVGGASSEPKKDK